MAYHYTGKKLKANGQTSSDGHNPENLRVRTDARGSPLARALSSLPLALPLYLRLSFLIAYVPGVLPVLLLPLTTC